MVNDCPNISDTSRLSTSKAARLLEIDSRTLKKYAAILNIVRGERKVGGMFYYGRDIKRIWLRLA